MNYTDFIDNFTRDNISEVTIDANANANRKDICSLNAEKGKSHDKLLSFNKIFYEMQKKYGIKDAREWLEAEWSGAFYLHDASTASQKPYCYSYDLTRLATEGLFFLSDNYNNEPPRHLDTFNDDFVEFVSWNANRTSGAVGAADYLIWSWYFWNKDKQNGKFWEKQGDKFIDASEKAREQSFQKIVYRLNQPFLRVDQSAFTNFSIFDRNYLEELFGGKEFPDGTFAIDHIEDFIEHEKSFMKIYSEIKKKNFMTFPIITISLLYQNGKFVDEEFARWASKHNMQFNDSNFFVSGDIGVLSSCCRMQNDTKKIKAFINSIGGTSLSIGSVKVNTINLMRIALESEKNENKYISILKDRVKLCMKTLDIVRSIINRNVEKGLLNNYIDGCIDMDK